MLSKKASSIVKKASGKSPEASYAITLQDMREPSETLSTVVFKFKTAITEDTVKSNDFNALAENLIAENLDIVGSIMHQLGLSEYKPKNRASGTINYIADEDPEFNDPQNIPVRLVNGRFAKISNIRSLLEIATKKYMFKYMDGHDGTLHNRTGRFINSFKLFEPVVDNVNERVSLYFTYMLYPYQVFDPYYVGRTKNLHLASEARNPRKIIGENLMSAAKDILSAKYKLKIAQRR